MYKASTHITKTNNAVCIEQREILTCSVDGTSCGRDMSGSYKKPPTASAHATTDASSPVVHAVLCCADDVGDVGAALGGSLGSG